MESLDSYQFKAVEFLLRHFDNPQTVRQIALQVQASPPSLHTAFKKLEKDGILKGKRFGTALFYSLNFNHPATQHLAHLVMLLKEPGKSAQTLKKLEARTVLAIKEKVLVVSNGRIETDQPHLQITHISEQEFLEKLKDKDKTLMDFIRQGAVVKGEQYLVKAIQQEVFRI